MVKGNVQRGLTLLIAVLIISVSMPFDAAAVKVFTDIGNGEWYDPYVIKAYEAGLITGYEDATFRPNDPISKVQVIICLARLAGYSEGVMSDLYIQKYKTVMSTNKIPDWANGYIAFGLEKEIVTGEELATFIKSDGQTQNNAKRSEVAIYLAKALGLEQEAKSYTNLVLGFVDNEIISQGSRGYIKVLFDRDIMKGDATNRFNPNNEITRAEVATMLSSSLKYAEEVVKPGVAKIEGTIQDIVVDGGRTVIKIAVNSGAIDMYGVAAGVTVNINGISSTLSGISVGHRGTFGIEDNSIISINVTGTAGATEGTVRSVFDGSDYRSITIEDDDGIRNTYKVTASTAIKLDGITVSLGQLSTGDKVFVTANGVDALRIEAERKIKNIMGIFGGLNIKNKTFLILKKGTEETEYPVDEDVDVRRDGRKRGIEDLRKGDEIEIKTEHGVVTNIEAKSRSRDVEGILESLLIARPHQLTIKTKDGERETFILPVDVSIRLDGEAVSIYDLRLDCVLNIEVESDEIVRIKAETAVFQNEVMGTVEYVNTDLNVITLRISDSSVGGYDDRQIFVNGDTLIGYRSNPNRERTIKNIEKGDRLMVMGHLEAGYFIADTIMITNK